MLNPALFQTLISLDLFSVPSTHVIVSLRSVDMIWRSSLGRDKLAWQGVGVVYVLTEVLGTAWNVM